MSLHAPLRALSVVLALAATTSFVKAEPITIPLKSRRQDSLPVRRSVSSEKLLDYFNGTDLQVCRARQGFRGMLLEVGN